MGHVFLRYTIPYPEEKITARSAHIADGYLEFKIIPVKTLCFVDDDRVDHDYTHPSDIRFGKPVRNQKSYPCFVHERQQ